MCNRSIDKKVYGGYAVLALQNLGYSENIIQDFWIEYENVIKRINEDTALENMNSFLSGKTRQVIFEGTDIPKEYNLVKISDLIKKHEFYDKKIQSACNRVCNALSNRWIIYIKDLYNKTSDELISIRNVTEQSYAFFIQTLKQIFKQKFL